MLMLNYLPRCISSNSFGPKQNHVGHKALCTLFSNPFLFIRKEVSWEKNGLHAFFLILQNTNIDAIKVSEVQYKLSLHSFFSLSKKRGLWIFVVNFCCGFLWWTLTDCSQTYQTERLAHPLRQITWLKVLCWSHKFWMTHQILFDIFRAKAGKSVWNLSRAGTSYKQKRTLISHWICFFSLEKICLALPHLVATQILGKVEGFCCGINLHG